MEFVPTEKTSTIRYPSIAHLMVDSADRNVVPYPLCNDFQISKNNSLLNGFFTRIGATEVVFEWNTPNVSAFQYNVTYTTNTGGPVGPVTLPTGFYTVANIINTLIEFLNGAALGITWTATADTVGTAQITYALVTAATFNITGSVIQLLFGQPTITQADFSPVNFGKLTLPGIDIRPARYIDIVSNQLTNNQSVKDASTAANVRDVLVRWYFDYDNQTPTDEYGYPILMGYSPFYLRRLYNPPKQIQWQSNIPVGNLSFQLYNNNGLLQSVVPETQFLMTLQISEN